MTLAGTLALHLPKLRALPFFAASARHAETPLRDVWRAPTVPVASPRRQNPPDLTPYARRIEAQLEIPAQHFADG